MISGHSLPKLYHPPSGLYRPIPPYTNVPHHSRDHGGHSGPSVPVGMGRETSLTELRTFSGAGSQTGKLQCHPTPSKSGTFLRILVIFWFSVCRCGWRPGDTARWFRDTGGVIFMCFARFFAPFVWNPPKRNAKRTQITLATPSKPSRGVPGRYLILENKIQKIHKSQETLTFPRRGLSSSFSSTFLYLARQNVRANARDDSRPIPAGTDGPECPTCSLE